MQKFCFVMVVSFSVGLGVNADTANGDTIVNVDARFNVPPNVSGSAGLVEQFLTAGDYTFTLVNNVNGHSSYHSQANQTGWSFHVPGSNWSTNYNFSYDDNDPTNDTLGSEFTGPDRGGGGRFVGAASALEAFDQTVAGNGVSRDIHIPFDQTVGFYFSDNVLSDNAGGVSIKIDAVAVPEPSAIGLLGFIGLGSCCFCRRRRR